MYITNPEVTQN
jgi:hypothetical protein